MAIAEIPSCVMTSYKFINSDSPRGSCSVCLHSHHIYVYREKSTCNHFMFKGLHNYKLSQPFTSVKLLCIIDEVYNKSIAKVAHFCTFTFLRAFPVIWKNGEILGLKFTGFLE